MESNYYIHDLDSIAFSVGSLVLPWYWLAYVGGFFFVYALSETMRRHFSLPLKKNNLIDIMLAGWIGLIVGGRVFYILFYNLTHFASDPWEVFSIWKGGMSFHGGLIGCGLAIYLVSRKKKISFYLLSDLFAISAPFAIGLGRLANFMNGELAGRVSTVPWAVIFPRYYDNLPRHPSQIYEALGEGFFLFGILFWQRRKIYIKPGALAVQFLILYGSIRFVLEFFRMPDQQIGFFWGIFTLGQILSVAMITGGLVLKRLSDQYDG